MKIITKKRWDQLFWKKLFKPVLLIGGIPFLICVIIAVSLADSHFDLSLGLILISTAYVTFVLLIGLGAGGIDFIAEYGYRDEAK